MRDYIPGRYFFLALIAATTATASAGMATDSRIVMVAFAVVGSVLLGVLSAAADFEARRHG